MPFLSDRIAVEEIDDIRWRLLEPVSYEGKEQVFTVPTGFTTDFASVPRFLTWLVPTYGRYTKAAILHDWLWKLTDAGDFDHADADGIFRWAMRELDVAFLRRWLMWAAVRLAGVRKSGLSTLWRPGFGQLAALVAVTLPGFLFVLVPGCVVLAALFVFYLAESTAFLILKIGSRRAPTGKPVKKVNPPSFRWTPS
ncbi:MULTISPECIES: DUF1353 domain-containing protein [Protofrankia]|uniref:DUF1353 domain-containing protein n=3 Tax=Candidatus Protofrankia datiscae TaxID=2716812 RepID=F8B5G3_9ACTN|nr:MULTISPECIES: DUF1353 domain-containing protein [Protofrankia]AEH08021.1 protein of unknown function DUF1353 [Candidatus Protofrankia datiscae]